MKRTKKPPIILMEDVSQILAHYLKTATDTALGEEEKFVLGSLQIRLNSLFNHVESYSKY
jgi:hypothetical protein